MKPGFYFVRSNGVNASLDVHSWEPARVYYTRSGWRVAVLHSNLAWPHEHFEIGPAIEPPADGGPTA